MFGQIKHQRNEGTNHRHEICVYTFLPGYIYKILKKTLNGLVGSAGP
jgi:hypothetical protein